MEAVPPARDGPRPAAPALRRCTSARPGIRPPRGRRRPRRRRRSRAGLRHGRARHDAPVARAAGDASARRRVRRRRLRVGRAGDRRREARLRAGAGRRPRPRGGAGDAPNAAVNGVAVAARRHDLVHDGPAPGAPLVLANLLRPLLLRVARDGFAGGEAPRHLVASGLLPEEGDEVAAAFAAHQGLRERTRRATPGWCALLLTS